MRLQAFELVDRPVYAHRHLFLALGHGGYRPPADVRATCAVLGTV